jgi:molybdopterin/thiamine biosynthesis adenylyltransferase
MEFDYNTAFSRNIGLITPQEQEKIKNARIAIAGLGGVGGVNLITLMRMGFTKFNIADFDHYEVGNFNRQFGANMDTLKQHKGEVMKTMALKINPEADIKLIPKALTEEILDEFLEGCDFYVDGLDVFEIQIRRKVFAKVRQRGMWSMTAGPIGFSTAWLVFDPKGLSFEDYFGFSTAKTEMEHFAAFIAGLTPARTQASYFVSSSFSFKNRRGSSNMLSCQLCSGVVGAEALKAILGRGTVRPVPAYHQFDAYMMKYKTGRNWLGGNLPLGRLKRWLIVKWIQKMDAQNA